MKWGDKYPDVGEWDDPREGVIRASSVSPCAVCGGATDWLEINYEAPICSEECLDRIDAEYEEALRR